MVGRLRLHSAHALRAAQARVQPWPAERVAAVRAALPDRYRALADCGAGLGMRQGEVFALAEDDNAWLRRGGAVVHVRRQVRIVAALLVFARRKAARSGTCPLPSSVALRLSAHIAAYPPVPVTLPWKSPDGRPVTARLVFTSRERTAVNRNYLNGCVWKPSLRAAGVPPERENGLHALRHYFASALLHNGVDIRALAAYLGHSDPGFTLRTYTHLMPDADERMRQAVDLVMNGTAEADGPVTAREGEG